jgi:hypothetical protein
MIAEKLMASQVSIPNIGNVWHREPTDHERTLCLAVSCRGLLSVDDANGGVYLADKGWVTPEYLGYLAQVKYPYEEAAQERFVQSVALAQLGNTQHGQCITALREQLSNGMALAQDPRLSVYVDGDGQNAIKEEFKFEFDHQPYHDPDQFRHKGRFHTACEDAGINTIPDTIRAAEDDSTPSVYDAVKTLVHDRNHTSIILRQSLAGGGGGNIAIKLKDCQYHVEEPNGKIVIINTEAALYSYLKKWNESNNDGVVIAPLLENAKTLSSTIDISPDGKIHVQYIAREITKHHSFMGCEVDTESMDPALKAAVTTFLIDLGQKLHQATGYSGPIQIDLLAEIIDGKYIIYPTESNFGRWTSPRQYAAIMKQLMAARNGGQVNGELTPFCASDHMETKSKSFNEALIRLSTVTRAQITHCLGEEVVKAITEEESVSIEGNCIITVPVHKVSTEDNDPNNIGVMVANTKINRRAIQNTNNTITLQELQERLESTDHRIQLLDLFKLVEHVMIA